MHEVQNLISIRAKSGLGPQKRLHNIGDKPRRLFVRAIQKEDPSPRRTETSVLAERSQDTSQRVLARSVQRGGKKRRFPFYAFAAVNLVFCATSGGYCPLTTVGGKSREQFQASANPLNIFARFPEFPGDRIPSKM